MWVTKLLISPVKKRIFCPKTTKFSPKLAFLSIADSFGALLVGWLVVVAWAVTRKTPIYFIKLHIINKEVHYLGLTFQFLHQFLIKTSQNVKLPLQALVHLLHIVGAPKSFAVVLFVIMHITSPDLLNVAQKKSPAHKFCHLPKEDKTMSSLQDTRLVSPLSLLPAT